MPVVTASVIAYTAADHSAEYENGGHRIVSANKGACACG